jgi:hypothetical protein
LLAWCVEFTLLYPEANGDGGVWLGNQVWSSGSSAPSLKFLKLLWMDMWAPLTGVLNGVVLPLMVFSSLATSGMIMFYDEVVGCVPIY